MTFVNRDLAPDEPHWTEDGTYMAYLKVRQDLDRFNALPVFSLKGKEVVVGFVVDADSGKTLGFEVLLEGDGRAFRRWLEPYAKDLGAEVIVSVDNDSYSVAAAELGLSEQLCIAHVRKYVSKRANSILEQAEKEWAEEEEEGEKLEKLQEG